MHESHGRALPDVQPGNAPPKVTSLCALTWLITWGGSELVILSPTCRSQQRYPWLYLLLAGYLLPLKFCVSAWRTCHRYERVKSRAPHSLTTRARKATLPATGTMAQRAHACFRRHPSQRTGQPRLLRARPWPAAGRPLRTSWPRRIAYWKAVAVPAAAVGGSRSTEGCISTSPAPTKGTRPPSQLIGLPRDRPVASAATSMAGGVGEAVVAGLGARRGEPAVNREGRE